MALYKNDGKINTTIVDGSAPVGLYSADGGVNIIVDDAGATHIGVTHPCGAMLVKSGTGSSYYNAKGNVYANRGLGAKGLE